jgi:hypothetical protein
MLSALLAWFGFRRRRRPAPVIRNVRKWRPF